MITSVFNYIKDHIDPRLSKPLLQQRSSGKPPHILIGLSGGPDSMFLLHILKKLADQNFIQLTAAHLNHGWRKESDIDEKLCVEICKKENIPLIIGHAKNFESSIKKTGSLEEFGRNLRATFFSTTTQKNNIDYVALAHHRNDQHETFFLRLIRGCSLEGLTGIKPVQCMWVKVKGAALRAGSQKQSITIIRPLLNTPKENILKYLTDHNISYATDATNASDNFLRNRIRNHIIPALDKADQRFNQTFEQTLATLTQENDFLILATKDAFHKTFNNHETKQLVGNKKIFLSLHPTIQKRLIMKWLQEANVPFQPSTGLLQEIIRFVGSERGGKHAMHENWLITKKQTEFWIERHNLPRRQSLPQQN